MHYCCVVIIHISYYGYHLEIIEYTYYMLNISINILMCSEYFYYSNNHYAIVNNARSSIIIGTLTTTSITLLLV